MPIAATTLELLDALERSIAKSRIDRVSVPGPPTVALAVAPTHVPADGLRLRIEKAGVSAEEFAAIFGVNAVALRGWLEKGGQVPAWVPPALQMLEALGPAARRRIFQLTASTPPEPKPRIIPAKTHPFSKIEDL